MDLSKLKDYTVPILVHTLAPLGIFLAGGWMNVLALFHFFLFVAVLFFAVAVFLMLRYKDHRPSWVKIDLKEDQYDDLARGPVSWGKQFYRLDTTLEWTWAFLLAFYGEGLAFWWICRLLMERYLRTRTPALKEVAEKWKSELKPAPSSSQV